MSASFLRLPHETLEEILLATIGQSILGPPSILHSLLLTCRDLYHILTFDVHPTFYARIFAQKFDLIAPHRRLGISELLPKHLKDELRTHCTAIRIFRKVLADASYDDPQLLAAFQTAYLMLLGDGGKNFAQLSWAGLPALVQGFLQHRLFSSVYENYGWPQENATSTLAVALFWLLTSSSTLNDESSKFRDDLMELLAPCVFAAFRYPCFNVSEHQYHPSDQTVPNKTEFSSVRSSSLPPRLQPIGITYFGHSVTFSYPTLASFAIVSYFARAETRPFAVPPHLPLNRIEAIALGVQGPTKDDVAHFNANCNTLFVEPSQGDRWDIVTSSWRHDPDWFRAVQCSNRSNNQSSMLPPRQSFHPPGTFTGRWQGSHIAPCMFAYQPLQASHSPAYQQVNTTRQPCYITFREHYCFSPSVPVPLPNDENTFKNGFLPPGCRFIDIEGGVNITDEAHSFNAFYETYRTEPVADGNLPDGLARGGPISSASRFFGAVDIIITGETDHERGQAWGSFKYIGRMRPSDGLIVLLREPLHRDMAELGRAIFRGYLMSSQNLVGRWRHVENADWEAIFSLCKEHEP